MAYLPIDAARFGTLQFVDAEPSEQGGVQRTSPDGVLEWRIRCLRTPERGRSGMVEISMPAAAEPRFDHLAEVDPEGLAVIIWTKPDGRHGYFFVADSLTAEG